MRALVCAVLASSSLLACDTAGTVPTTSNLQVNPNEIPVAAPTMLNGTLQFSDSDGDVNAVWMKVISPSGAESAPSHLVLPSTGAATGALSFALQLQAPTAGTYAVEVWVEDAEGHTSEPDSVDIVAR